MPAVRANGITIEYEPFGPNEGVPVLLIHGFGQQLVAWPPEFLEGFTLAGMRVVVYDNRDTGLSTKFDGRIPDLTAVGETIRAGKKPNVPYLLDDMAADAAGLLDALGIESAHVVGASMGGMIAQLVALDHPAKARSLIAVFTTPGDDDLPPPSREAHLSLMSQPPAQDRGSIIAHMLTSRLAYASPGYPSDDERAARLFGQAYDRMYYPEGTLRHWSAIAASPPRGGRLRGLNLPALVLHGADDALLSPAHGRRIADRIRGARYYELPGWGHDMPAGVIPQLHNLMVPFILKVEAAQR